MCEFTIKIDYINYFHDYNDIREHLLELNGIKDVVINEDKNIDLINIDVKYNEKVINDERIKLEILGFLKLLNYPSVYGFDRHKEENKLQLIKCQYSICCDFCFGNIMDILYDTKGIVKVESDFYQRIDDGKDNQYTISIYYDPQIIDDVKLQEIIKKIEVYG